MSNLLNPEEQQRAGAQHAAAQARYDRFYTMLRGYYAGLFGSDADYARVSTRTTPDELARKMTASLASGTADKYVTDAADGKAVKHTCAALGIKHTYKAIRQYLGVQS